MIFEQLWKIDSLYERYHDQCKLRDNRYCRIECDIEVREEILHHYDIDSLHTSDKSYDHDWALERSHLLCPISERYIRVETYECLSTEVWKKWSRYYSRHEECSYRYDNTWIWYDEKRCSKSRESKDDPYDTEKEELLSCLKYCREKCTHKRSSWEKCYEN